MRFKFRRSRGGGILIKCRKCGYDGDMGLKMSYLKNEYEIENPDGEPILSLDKDNETSTDR